MASSSAMTVIIPTFNRLSTLRLCLERLEAQTITDFDVIIVNDGSTDGTEAALANIQENTPLRLQVLHQQNSGPARARNWAIAHATEEICLLIGDDILATPNLLDAHLQFHRANPDDKAVGLGRTQWDRDYQEITPFMEWYEEIQFDYGRLVAGLTPTWQHFYTSNLSFKTRLFQANPFDERFKAAAWEDIELGFRLANRDQMHLTFLPNAIASHVHPTTFLQAVRRMRTLGRSERQFHQIWPSAQDISARDVKAKICTILGARPLLLDILTSSVDRLSGPLKPGKLHAMLLRSHQQRGYLESNL
jgi:glycosyltransferase involved in cell wall biosynthesis